MDNLPFDEHLPVEILSAGFRNVTNSYKFFWFLAILEHIQEDHSRVIPIDQLLARMVAWVWYPTNYFKLSDTVGEFLKGKMGRSIMGASAHA
jgi:hypothetical protein